MKKRTKMISLIMIIAMIFTQFAMAEEINETKIIVEFTDLDETNWAYESIEKLVDAGIILGYPDKTFRPDGNIKRAELIKIVNLVFSYSDKQEATKFIDIKQDDWFYDNILIAEKSGYIDGYTDGTFRPNGYITRQELCKILDTINGFVALPFDKSITDEVSPWAEEYVSKIISNRIMNLDENNNFRATEKATRADVCDALSKFLLVEEKDEETVVETPSNGGSSNTNDETITEEELSKTMDTVIRRLDKGVIPNLTSEAQEEIVKDIIINMTKYKTDNNYDYEESANKTYEKYKKLTEKEQEDLKYQIQLQNSTKDLLDLKDFFFPEVDI